MSSGNPDRGWRLMLWAGVVPALIILVAMTRVKESPVWLEQQRLRRESKTPIRRVSIGRLFDRDLRSVTIHTSLLMAAFMFSYHSITFWYATFLGTMKLPPLGYLIALNAGGLFGSIALGQLSETRLGRRGAPTLGMIVGTLSAPLYLWASDPTLLLIGAALVGFGASGAWGIVPGYLSERFPTEARAVGTGFAYHVGAGARGAFTPFVIGALRDGGMPLGVCDADVHQHRRRVGARDVVARAGNARAGTVERPRRSRAAGGAASQRGPSRAARRERPRRFAPRDGRSDRGLEREASRAAEPRASRAAEAARPQRS